MSRVGISLLFALLGVALFADLLSGSLPVVARHRGTLYVLPALTRPPALRGENLETLRAAAQPGDFAWSPLHPFGPDDVALGTGLAPPSAEHPLGTDELGRDVLARVLHGGRVSLGVGIVVALLAVLLGTLLGGVAGYYGGFLDLAISRVIEILMTFPTFFFALAVMGMLKTPALWPLILTLGLTRWIDIARLTRAEVMRLRELDYASASRALGASGRFILFRHLLPNALAPVLVAGVFTAGNAILVESGLSFLGFGVPPPQASWGELLAQANRYLTYPGAWWLTLFPGLALFLTLLALNLVGESLRDRLDPRLRQEGRAG